MATDAEKKAYTRGYHNAAIKRGWPEHRPPYPPQPIVHELMEALRNLRDTIDSELAKFDEGDPLNKTLDPAIERADTALRKVTHWLKKLE